jgi:hypothetical protein
MNNIATSVATCRTIVRIIHENKSIYKLNGDLGTFHFRRQYCSRVEMEKDLWGFGRPGAPANPPLLLPAWKLLPPKSERTWGVTSQRWGI